jgi:Domain of unknown function (DUF4105)
MKKILALTFVLIIHYSLFITHCQAQDSSHLRISLLTCTPGDELYSTFGHTAIRVIDSSSTSDIVYNYGTFNFDDDGFYIKFAQGKLLYFVSAEQFEDFKYLYQATNRGITEQLLNLTAAEKVTVQNFLTNNLKEENRYYKYDFFFDNCTTRLRDIIKKNHDSAFTTKPVMPFGTTFRNAIHQYLNRNKKEWSKLSIDLLLGKPCDGVMTAAQMQFLPDNLMISLDSSTVPIVLTHQNLYALNNDRAKASLFTPLNIFILLLLAIVLLSFSKNKFAKALVNGFDGLLFFLTGVLGIILVLMWVATDHSMTKQNFNLLWAWPTHTIAAFFIYSKKNWVKKYFAFTAVAAVLVLLGWFFLPQQLNTSLIPLVLLLVYRSAAKGFTGK